MLRDLLDPRVRLLLLLLIMLHIELLNMLLGFGDAAFLGVMGRLGGLKVVDVVDIAERGLLHLDGIDDSLSDD